MTQLNTLVSSYWGNLATLPPAARAAGVVLLARKAAGPDYAAGVLRRIQAGVQPAVLIRESILKGYRGRGLGTNQNQNTGSSGGSSGGFWNASGWDTREEVEANLTTITNIAKSAVETGVDVGTMIDDAIHGRTPEPEPQGRPGLPAGTRLLSPFFGSIRVQPSQPQGQGGLDPLLLLGIAALVGSGAYLLLRKTPEKAAKKAVAEE
jgi:hypothetical protein